MANPHEACALERILWQNPNLKEDRERRAISSMACWAVIPPPGFKGGFVSNETTGEWRESKVIACADVVITTRLSDDTPAVVASLRAPNTPFGNCWWMQGGGIPGYTPLQKFVRDHAMKECGAEVKLEALIGFFYTNAEDHHQSTMQPCFVGSVPFDGLSEKLIADNQHADVRLLTLRDLGELPKEQKHWYPATCFHAALESMPG